MRPVKLLHASNAVHHSAGETEERIHAGILYEHVARYLDIWTFVIHHSARLCYSTCNVCLVISIENINREELTSMSF